ncbi:MAG: SLC13 family permease [Fluviicola sp.]
MTTKRIIFLASTALFLIAILFINTSSDLKQADINFYNAIAMGTYMVVLWLTEAINIFITALIPLVAGNLLGLISTQELAESYGDKMVYLFLGGFVLALALEKWHIHTAIASRIIKVVGNKKGPILFGFLMTTGFLSMWVSNTATALMMLPMAIAIVELQPKGQRKGKFSIFIILAVAYGANIGGMGTLIGSPPNTQMAGILESTYHIKVSFMDWFKVGAPAAFFMLLLAYGFFWLLLGKERNERLEGYEHEIHTINKDQWKIIGIFTFVVTLWIIKDFAFGKTGWLPFIKLEEANVAIFGAVLMLLIPTKNDTRKTLLKWDDLKEVPWGILLMFGGGLALSKALDTGKVVDFISMKFQENEITGYLSLLLVIVIFSVFLTELLSNLAMVTLMIPIIADICLKTDVAPLALCLPATLAASCGFMMPVGTPPNAIAYSSGIVPMKKMLLYGFVTNWIAIVVIIALSALFF